MGTIHIPEGLLSFHIGRTQAGPRHSRHRQPKTVFLKRVVADLKKWLRCSWAAGMVPSNSGQSLVPELDVICVSGNTVDKQLPDLICPIPNAGDSGIAAIVAIGPRKDGVPYSEEDRRFADTLCNHIGGLLNDERLAQDVTEDLIDDEQTERDVEAARNVYERLDHCRTSAVPGLEYGGQCQRAEQAHGDFFDLIARAERDLVIAIGNVTARGLPGGIMLGGTLASVRALVNRGESLVQIALELNRTLWEISPEDSFTSFLCLQIDPSRRYLRYVNAGHEPALLLRRRTGHVDRLERTGTVLGLSRRSTYREHFLPFDSGDLLAAFTDGIAESAGPDEVVRILREGSNSGVHELATHVLDAAQTAADRTIVLVRASNVEEHPLKLERYQLVAA